MGPLLDFRSGSNRCGVLAGAGTIWNAEQGIFSIGSTLTPPGDRTIYGFGGEGLPVRDAFHPQDLAVLVTKQMTCSKTGGPAIYNVGWTPEFHVAP